MKTKTHTPKSHPCFECEGGILLPICEPFTTRTSEGLEITVPDVAMERCNTCGDTVLSGEATAYVNDYLDRATSRPRPEFVTADPDFWKPKEMPKVQPVKK